MTDGIVKKFINVRAPIKRRDVALRTSTKAPYVNGHWSFPEAIDPTRYVGFIYVVVDKLTNKKYLGKKLLVGTGKLNKGKESDWKTYKTSSNELKPLIATFGEDRFSLIIVEQYRTKATLAYAETWSLVLANVVYEDAWYNTQIERISWRCVEHITERHKQRLNALINDLSIQPGII